MWWAAEAQLFSGLELNYRDERNLNACGLNGDLKNCS